MRKLSLFATLLVVSPLSVGFPSAAQQPSPPAPLVDRVGFPADYRTQFVPLFAFDRPDARQIRVIYGNHIASNSVQGQPYPYGAVLVMETYRAASDAQGNIARDATGRFIRDALTAIFVMRKERGFGIEYEQNRTGEWEYVAFRTDGSYQTQPRDSHSCANCHLMATANRDWVFRGHMLHERTGSTGAVPDAVLQHYSFIPAAIRIRAGSSVTWLNDDEIDHRVAITTGQLVESPTLTTGTTFRARFNSPGEYDVTCRIHPTMRARVTVDP